MLMNNYDFIIFNIKSTMMDFPVYQTLITFQMRIIILSLKCSMENLKSPRKWNFNYSFGVFAKILIYIYNKSEVIFKSKYKKNFL
jgi:hypothetical protein